MSGEKHSSPRGDPGLPLCGGCPKKKNARYLVRPLGLKTVFLRTPIILGTKRAQKRALEKKSFTVKNSLELISGPPVWPKSQ